MTQSLSRTQHHFELEENLVRILNPEVAECAEKAAARIPAAQAYLVRHKNHLYIDLDALPNSYRREQVFRLLQRYQIGDDIDMRLLPPDLRQLLEPSRPSKSRFVFVLMVSVAVGILCGLTAMASSVLANAAIELITNSPAPKAATDMDMGVVSFVLFGALGSGASAIFVWRHTENWPVLDFNWIAGDAFQKPAPPQQPLSPESGQTAVHTESSAPYPPDAKMSG